MNIPDNRIAVSVKEAAEMLALSTRRVSDLLNEGRIESRYHGSKRLVSVDSITEYFKSLPTEREQAAS